MDVGKVEREKFYFISMSMNRACFYAFIGKPIK